MTKRIGNNANRKPIVGFLLAAWVLLLLAPAGHAQVDTATLVGTVKDPTGAIVPGASVLIVNLGTNVSRSFTTDDNGDFRVPALPVPAKYRVTVEKTGFSKAVMEEVNLSAFETLRLDFALGVGESSQTITVKDTPPVVNSETVTMGESTSWEKLNNYVLPIPKMSATQRLTMLSLQSVVNESGQVRISGARTDMTRFTYDGATVDSNWSMPWASNTTEAKMVTVNANAEYATPVTVSATSSSGNNLYHANLVYEINNAALNALGPYPTDRGPGVGGYNAAASGGGPVILPKIYNGRNRTFFYASYNYSNPYKYFAEFPNTVPTLAMRSGDFSQYKDGAGNLIPIIDPRTGAPFPGNVIPPSRINATSRNIIDKFYPKPNRGDPNVAFENYITPYRENGGTKYIFLRGDQNLTSRNTLNFSFTRASQDGQFDTAGSGVGKVVGLYNAVNNFWSTNYAAGWTGIISPQIVNEFRFHYNYINSLRGSNVNGQDVLKAFGISGIDPSLNFTGVPNINIDGFDGFGQVYNPNTMEERRWNYIDNLSLQRGKHAFKFGFAFIRVHDDINGATGPVFGTYNFSGRFTQDATGNNGNPFADFELGVPDNAQRFTPRGPTLNRNYSLGLYAQDDFKITPRLTLSLGVRYDLDAVPYDANGLYFGFDPKTGGLVLPSQKAIDSVSPAFNKSIPLELASSAGFPSKLLVQDKNNLYPRVGLAFRPFNDARMVLRVGYGVFNVGKFGGANRFTPMAFVQTGGPFALTESFINLLKPNGDPELSFPNPFPSTTGSASSSYAITATNPNLRDAYQQQWNIAVEREFWKTAFSVAYIGSKATGLNYRRNINLPAPSTTPYSPSRLLYRNFTSIAYVDQGANDSYNSMQVEVNRPLSRGLYLHGGWIWAKQITDAESSGSADPLGSLSTNPYDRRYDRGRSDYVPTHRLVIDYIYQMPFGRKKRYLRSLPGVLNHIVGGWTNSTFVHWDTGRPFTPIYRGPDASGTGSFSGRPDRIGSGTVANPTQVSLYDPKAFMVPQANIGRFGNSGRNILTYPASWTVTTAIHKDFPIWERVNLRISGFLDNPFNMHTWSYPDRIITSPTAGMSTYFLPDPRMIRFSAKLEF